MKTELQSIRPASPTRGLWRTPPVALTLALTLALGVAPAFAGKSVAEVQARYAREQARCMTIKEHGARANCLSESSTARAQALPAEVDPDPGRYARNALERCKPLPADDRAACEARIQGQGTTSGSVAGGGIYRELVIREIREPAQPKP